MRDSLRMLCLLVAVGAGVVSPGCGADASPHNVGGSGGSGGASVADAGGMDTPVTVTSSGLSRATAISDLTDDQKSTLCDWWNNKQGGYGQTADCASGASEADDADQADCVDSIDDCDAATVADFEDCGNAIGTGLCMFRTAATCATLSACFTPN